VKRDYYEVLGVARDADGAELKRAYRDLAMRYHPDKNPGSREAEERFKELSEAYAVLSDPEKRARYDRVGHSPFDGAGFDAAVGSFTELFDNLFGDLFGRKKQKASGRDLRYTLEIEFAEAALGCEKAIAITARGDCKSCKGTGARGGAPAGLATCTACAGKGEVKVAQGFFSVGKPCSQCVGTGKVVVDPCPDCKGAGVTEGQREFTVTIPPGTEDGGLRRVAGQGEPGRRGGTPGDLNVVVRVKPHPLFKREGRVVVCELPLSYSEAALGASIDVPTLDGSVEMRVPPGTQSGTVFRLKGKGIKQGSGGGRGDAHVRVLVETPVALTDRQRKLLEELEKEGRAESGPKRAEFTERMRESAKPDGD
jgi:molecular chaperone DnaJ